MAALALRWDCEGTLEGRTFRIRDCRVVDIVIGDVVGGDVDIPAQEFRADRLDRVLCDVELPRPRISGHGGAIEHGDLLLANV